MNNLEFAKNIPDALAILPQWVCWGAKGKPRKMPFDPRTGSPAKAGQPETWADFQTAAQAVEAGRFEGVGFEFDTAGCVVGIDFDHCLHDGKCDPWVEAWVKKLNSYTEISPSGEGLHVFCSAHLPGQAIKRKEAEMYDRGRYFTMTGRPYGPEKPLRAAQDTVNALYAELQARAQKQQERPTEKPAAAPGGVDIEDAPLIAKMKKGRNGAAFSALWNGDISAYPSHSEADVALCNILAWWTNGDPARMDRLFRQSGLMREKWDRKQSGTTYGAITIKNAADSTRGGYDPAGYATESRALSWDDEIPAGQSARDHPQAAEAPPAQVEKQQPTKKAPLFLPASSFETRTARYLIEPYIPRGMLSIIGGVSGTGKTSLALSLAAAVSSGRALPFEAAGTTHKPENVLYLTVENDPHIVLRPRVEAMGADIHRLFFLDGVGVNMTSPELRDFIKQEHISMLVFDPIQSFLPAGTQMGRAEQIRPIMDKVIDLSASEDLATILISHMSKPGPGVVSALDRLLGSSDFRNAARSIMIVGRDPENPDQRVFAHAKNSIGLPGPAQRYHISDGGLVVFDGETTLTADQIIAQTENAAPRAQKAANTLNAAISDLDKALGFMGWVDVATVYTLSAAAGYSDRTMRRAKDVMGLKVLRTGMQPNQKTYWYRNELTEATVKADIMNENEPLTLDDVPTMDKSAVHTGQALSSV